MVSLAGNRPGEKTDNVGRIVEIQLQVRVLHDPEMSTGCCSFAKVECKAAGAEA